MPFDITAPSAPSVIAEARARGYRMVPTEHGLCIFYPDTPQPDDDIDFWHRLRAVPQDKIIAALEADPREWPEQPMEKD